MTDDSQRIVATLSMRLEQYSVASVARASGLSRAGIYKALAADKCPRLDTIERIADALGYRVALEPKEEGERQMVPGTIPLTC